MDARIIPVGCFVRLADPAGTEGILGLGALGKAFAEIARSRGMALVPCAEGDELAAFGADCGGCMTPAAYERALGRRLRFPAAAPARKACACYLGGDIGAYNTCGHMCRYCYANASAAAVRANRRAHDPDSPLLTGHLMPGDVVRQARQRSWIDGQMRMDLPQPPG